MGGVGVSRARRVRCGAVLLPSRLLPSSSAAFVCRRSLPPRVRGRALTFHTFSSCSVRPPSLPLPVAAIRPCRPPPLATRPASASHLSSASHILLMAAALSAAVAFLAPHLLPKHPSPSFSSAGRRRFARALQLRQSPPGGTLTLRLEC